MGVLFGQTGRRVAEAPARSARAKTPLMRIGDRPRRHQDRGAGDGRRGLGARPAARRHAAARLRRHPRARLLALVHALEQRVGGPASVGVGMPGIISPATGLVKNANSTWLIGRPFDRDLERVLGRPVRLANDANCFALSEATDGAAAGAACRLRRDPRHRRGRRPRDRRAHPRRRASHRGRMGPQPAARAAPTMSGRARRATAGAAGASRRSCPGPGWAEDTARRTGRRLDARWPLPGGRATATRRPARPSRATPIGWRGRWPPSSTSSIPDVIVLGGGLSNLDALYEDVPRAWVPHVFSDEVHTRLVRARHGDSSWRTRRGVVVVEPAASIDDCRLAIDDSSGD